MCIYSWNNSRSRSAIDSLKDSLDSQTVSVVGVRRCSIALLAHMQLGLSSVSVATCDEELPEVGSLEEHRPPSNDHRLIHSDRVGSICEPAQRRGDCYLIFASSGKITMKRNFGFERLHAPRHFNEYCSFNRITLCNSLRRCFNNIEYQMSNHTCESMRLIWIGQRIAYRGRNKDISSARVNRWLIVPFCNINLVQMIWKCVMRCKWSSKRVFTRVHPSNIFSKGRETTGLEMTVSCLSYSLFFFLSFSFYQTFFAKGRFSVISSHFDTFPF